MLTRQQIAEGILGCALEDGQFAPCPGRAKHSKGNGRRDFRVILDGAPTGHCFHTSCGGEVAAFNDELRRAIWKAEQGESWRPNPWLDGVANEPRKREDKRPQLNEYAVWEFTRDCPEITEEWFAARSALDVATVDSRGFLDALYEPGEVVLVFTEEYSQGDFCAWIGKGTYRLSQQRKTRGVPSELPGGGKKGVWFLTNPVSGKWEINAVTSKGGKPPEWTRRSEVNVTAWRYFVLESDSLDAARWLKVLAHLPLPIAAIYTSGRRSIHALARIPVSSKAEWDAARNIIRATVCPLGGDPGALSAVRLSRLPGCDRGEGKQRLLYLNPRPDYTEIRHLVPRTRAVL